jgi:hypothetical protein
MPVGRDDACRAARGGHLEVVQWRRAHGCPWNASTLRRAAQSEHHEVFLWAMYHGCGRHEIYHDDRDRLGEEFSRHAEFCGLYVLSLQIALPLGQYSDSVTESDSDEESDSEDMAARFEYWEGMCEVNGRWRPRVKPPPEVW